MRKGFQKYAAAPVHYCNVDKAHSKKNGNGGGKGQVGETYLKKNVTALMGVGEPTKGSSKGEYVKLRKEERKRNCNCRAAAVPFIDTASDYNNRFSDNKWSSHNRRSPNNRFGDSYCNASLYAPGTLRAPLSSAPIMHSMLHHMSGAYRNKKTLESDESLILSTNIPSNPVLPPSGWQSIVDTDGLAI